MGIFGKNPHGDNLYRIIFGPSRTHLVYGEWPNGERKAQWVKKYPEVGDSWVLERWMTPFEYARCTPDEWNQTLTVLGPYPDRGEYELCHRFELVNPADESIVRLIDAIEQGHKQTRRNGAVFDNPDNTQACLRIAEEEQASTSSQMQALIGNALPAFGADAMVGYGGGRSSKGGKVVKSAQEAGLPVIPRSRQRGKDISRSTLIAGDRLVAQP